MQKVLEKKKRIFTVCFLSPKDHHSLLQLYLDGPKDKLFNICSFEKELKEKVQTKKSFGYDGFLRNKKLSKIKNTQKLALIKSFLKKNIPFRELKIKEQMKKH